MANSFVSEWARKKSRSLSRQLAGKVHSVPLRDTLSKTTYKLNRVQKRLEDSGIRIGQKYNALFKKCVYSQELQDFTSATMYANECTQVRKMAQTILMSGLALKSVTLRLNTIREFGDVAVDVIPAVKIIHTLKGRLAGVLPEVSMQLGQIGSTLDALVFEAGQATSQTWSSMPAGEDAEKILAEASAIADQKVHDDLPPLPVKDSKERELNP